MYSDTQHNTPDVASNRITVVNEPCDQIKRHRAHIAEKQASKDASSNGSLYAAHEKIYPREIKGKYQTIRHMMTIGVLLAFYGLAWLDWSDRQAVLFDLPARQFSIFSITFWPQDFYILTLCLIIAALTLFAATALAGRLWCGYACPQTVWTTLYLWIERATEGPYSKRRKLDAAPWSFEKALKKGTKQFLWVSLALWTGFTFVGYFTPIKSLATQAYTLNFGGWEWFWILFYGLATYGNAGFLREQVCQYMCPYARFQSAMLDPNSLVISYDASRGEPRKRSALKKSTTDGDDVASSIGDCVDCKICVQVCPTNIDIRDGLQYECIGCAACIDACNSIMKKLNKPLGLIRYTSEYALSKQLSGANRFAKERSLLLRKIFRPRLLIYATLWAGLLAILGLTLVFRNDTAVDIIRDRKAFYYEVVPGYVDNVYTLRIMNKSQKSHRYSLSVADQPSAQLINKPERIQVAPGDVYDLPIRLRLPESTAHSGAHPITFALFEENSGHITQSDTLFWYPR